jgi:ligand-binding sensor domain-containing protein
MLRTRTILFSLFLLFFGIPHYSPAQTYNFRNYTVDDGLPFIQVYAIFQDNKGNLWSGGYGGLSRFNGKSFTNFTPREGLANHYVTSIGEDKTNHLWAGTFTGLSKLENGRFRNYYVKDGLPDDHITSLFTDSRGRLWIGTINGLCVMADNKFSPLTFLLDSVSKNVQSINEDSQHRMWIGTENGMVMVDNTDRIIHVLKTSYGMCDNHMNCMYEDVLGNIWIGTDKGITRFEKSVKRGVSTTALKDINVSAISSDLQGNIWCSTELGLWKYDGKQFKSISIGHDLNANKTKCLYVDFEKNMWIGTNSGLYRYRSADFVTFGQNEGLNTPFVYQITEDRNKNLWIGTSGGGLYVYRDDHFYNFTRADGLPGNNVLSVIEAKDGTMWIGTDKGYCTCKSLSSPAHKPVFEKPAVRNKEAHDSINIIMQDSKGVIWLGGNNGVGRMENNTFTWLPIPKQKIEFSVYSLFEDQKGDLWIGTYLGGLFKYDGKKIQNMNQELGLESASYLAILQDKEGIYYFGSLDGVYMYDPSGRYEQGKKVIRFGETDGMSSDLVWSMVFDEEEEIIWVGTNQALNKLYLGAFKHSGKKHIVPYGKEEGFSGVECNSSGVCRQQNGVIWFGTVNGLIKYDPRAYKPNTAEAKTSIIGIRLFYTDTLMLQNTELRYDRNNISFEYIGVCLTNPYKVKYKVMLEGFDKSWSPETRSNVATYSNLPPGSYTFKVKSCNNEDTWTEVPAAFSFTILAPFWKRWWFSVAVGLFLAGLTVVLFTYRIGQVRQNENMKVRIAANELKALRSQMNPHFIFNSLNSIQHFIMNNDEVSASKYLNTFAKLIRTILNNSERATASIREELDSLRLYLQLEALRFENKFEYEITVDPELDIDYHEVPTMLIQPFAENAIIHGLLPKMGSGKLEIRIFRRDNFILCTIVDNGIGRERARALKEQSIRKTHKSFGMKITQDRLELLNYLNKSNLSVNITDLHNADQTPAGTKVEIYIPIF